MYTLTPVPKIHAQNTLVRGSGRVTVHVPLLLNHTETKESIKNKTKTS